MKGIILAFAMGGLVLPVWGQDRGGGQEGQDKDLIGESKAPVILKKVQGVVAKAKGYHASETVTTPQMGRGGQGGGETPSFEGIVVKDVAAMKGSAELYAKATTVLVKSKQGQFLPPSSFNGQEGTIAGSFRNPAVVMAEYLRFAATAFYDGDEAVEGIDCRIVATTADERTLADQIKEISANMGELKRFGVGDISGYVDKKSSTSSYKAWVGKTDLKVYRLEWHLELIVDKDKIPGGFGQGLPDKIEASVEIKISKYDEELDWDWPKEIKAKFGVK